MACKIKIFYSVLDVSQSVIICNCNITINCHVPSFNFLYIIWCCNLLSTNGCIWVVKMCVLYFYCTMLCISMTYAVMQCLSVRLSLSRSWILSRWISVSSEFSSPLDATPYQTLWQYSDGASNAGVIGTNHDGRVAGYRSTTAAVCDPQLTVLVYNSYGAGLFTEQIATHQWIRQKEQNRI